MSTRIRVDVAREALVQVAQQAQQAARTAFVQGQVRQRAAEGAKAAVEREQKVAGVAANGEDQRRRRRQTERVRPRPAANRRPVGGGVAGFFFDEYLDEATNDYMIKVWSGDGTASVAKQAAPGAVYVDEYEEDSSSVGIPSPIVRPYVTSTRIYERSKGSDIRNVVFRLPAGGDRIIALVHSTYQVAEQIIDEDWVQDVSAEYLITSGTPSCVVGTSSAPAVNVFDISTTFTNASAVNLGAPSKQWHGFLVTKTTVKEITVPASVQATLAPYVFSTLFEEGDPAMVTYGYSDFSNWRYEFIPGPGCTQVFDVTPNPYPGTSNTIYSYRPSRRLAVPLVLRREGNKALHQLGVVKGDSPSVPFPPRTDGAGILRVLEIPSTDVSGTPTPAQVLSDFFPGVTAPRESIREKIIPGDPVATRRFERANVLTYSTVPEGTTFRQVPTDDFPLTVLDAVSSPTFHAAWDWGNPSYCRSKLISFGFLPSDLVP